MHFGIAHPRWREKRSRHSRRMRTRKFAYLTRGLWHRSSITDLYFFMNYQVLKPNCHMYFTHTYLTFSIPSISFRQMCFVTMLCFNLAHLPHFVFFYCWTSFCIYLYTVSINVDVSYVFRCQWQDYLTVQPSNCIHLYSNQCTATSEDNIFLWNVY